MDPDRHDAWTDDTVRLVGGADGGRHFVRRFDAATNVREDAAGDVLASPTTMRWNVPSKAWTGGAAWFPPRPVRWSLPRRHGRRPVSATGSGWPAKRAASLGGGCVRGSAAALTRRYP
jgi:hypothetical protein